jgi:hypothetical protein
MARKIRQGTTSTVLVQSKLKSRQKKPSPAKTSQPANSKRTEAAMRALPGLSARSSARRGATDVTDATAGSVDLQSAIAPCACEVRTSRNKKLPTFRLAAAPAASTGREKTGSVRTANGLHVLPGANRAGDLLTWAAPRYAGLLTSSR